MAEAWGVRFISQYSLSSSRRFLPSLQTRGSDKLDESTCGLPCLSSLTRKVGMVKVKRCFYFKEWVLSIYRLSVDRYARYLLLVRSVHWVAIILLTLCPLTVIHTNIYLLPVNLIP